MDIDRGAMQALGVVDDVPRPLIFYMDSDKQAFDQKANGSVKRAVCNAIRRAAEHHLQSEPEGDATHSGTALLDEVKGYTITQKVGGVSQTFKGA
jgi:hypothetical protein